MDLGEKPKISPNLGIFVIEIPKNRNFENFWILGEFVFKIWVSKEAPRNVSNDRSG